MEVPDGQVYFKINDEQSILRNMYDKQIQLICDLVSCRSAVLTLVHIIYMLIVLGAFSKNQNGNLRWFLPLGIDPHPSPPNGQNFQTFFYHTFFLLQLTPTQMKRILHLVSVKNITFKSSYNWFKIDIHQQLRPLTANYLAMSKVISTTIYT